MHWLPPDCLADDLRLPDNHFQNQNKRRQEGRCLLLIPSSGAGEPFRFFFYIAWPWAVNIRVTFLRSVVEASQ